MPDIVSNNAASKIAIERLYRQQLDGSHLKTPAEVVGWLGVVQAQDYAGGKWSVGLRLPSSTDDQVEQAIANREIVRTWALRGTLHFITPEDIRWMLKLVGPRLIAGNARRYQELELDEATLNRSTKVLVNALQGGKQVDRRSLRLILEQDGISTEGQRGVYMLQRASLEGLICQGVANRSNPSFMLIDEALPPGKSLEHDEALSHLTMGYFTSHAPACLQDFAWWSGLLMTDVRQGLEAVKSQLVSEAVDGQVLWRPHSQPANKKGPMKAYLLPSYDDYLLGYTDRRAALGSLDAKKMNPNNGFSQTIAIDGRIVGAWKRSLQKGKVAIAPHLFYPLSAVENEALAVSARSFGKFLGMPEALLEPVMEE